jgi:acyl-CoA thioesterase FadM
MLFVSAELSKLKGARFIFDQTVRRDTADGEVLCRGTAEVACMDVELRKPRRIPATLLSELTE